MIINTKPLYSLLEKVTFGKGLPRTVNGVRIKLPARYIRYFETDYEAANFSFLKSACKEGAVVIDIGAHIGLFSGITAKIIGSGGKIFAFEPTPNTMSVLQQTIRINNLGHVVEPVMQAMGKETGNTTFFISDNEADNSNSLVSYKADRNLKGLEVEINTIDNFVTKKKLSRVDFIKIDAEGAEYDVLLGGAEVFRIYRPSFILAIHPEPIATKGDKMEDIYDLLVELNYKILFNNEPISKIGFCSKKDLFDLQLIPK
jgi:FkbM family methyltransferase